MFSKISESILISVRCKASCSCSVVEGRREITRAMTVRTVLSRLKNLSKVIFECLESTGKVSVKRVVGMLSYIVGFIVAEPGCSTGESGKTIIFNVI